MPPVQNRKPRVFRAIELRANWLEIEVSEVDCISNEIEFKNTKKTPQKKQLQTSDFTLPQHL
jgi:hypothetical protein